MRTATFILAMLASVTLFGKLTKQEIKTIATKWINSDTANITQVYDLSPSTTCVQFSNGWVLVCNAENSKPVVGYSYNGHYLTPSDSLGMEFMETILQIAPNVKPEGSNNTKVILSENFERYRTRAAQPLLDNEWGQRAPFNSYCPANSSGTRALTGCVPTAIAQIMAYWKFPPAGYESHTYSPSNTEFGTLSVNFHEQSYNWNSMTNEDIAKLMYHLGVAFESDYGTSETSTYSRDVVMGLVKYFNYSPTIQYLYKDNFTNDSWILLLKTELDSLRPLYYAGGRDRRHAWVIDGYDENDMFHFNMGWSGSYNGYYSLNSLVNFSGKEYSFNNRIIKNIFPSPHPERRVDYSVNFEFKDENFNPRIHFVETDSINFHIKFINVGTAISNDSLEYEFYIDGELERSSQLGLPFIDFFDDITRQSNQGSFSAGIHEVKIIVDPRNLIDELSETNNEFVTHFQVFENSAEELKPDAWVEATHFLDEGIISDNLSNLGLLSLIATFSNRGNEISRSVLRFNVYLDSELLLEQESSNSLRFLDSSNISAHIPLGTDIELGTHTVKIVLDPDNLIDELDETNNEFEFFFSVEYDEPRTVDPSVAFGPFLANGELSDTLYEGDEISVQYVMFNAGNTSSEEVIWYQAYIDDHLINSIGDYYILQRVGLPNYIVPYSLLDTLSAGNHTYKIIFDPNNEVQESNETNNVFEIDFNVVARPLEKNITFRQSNENVAMWLTNSAGNSISRAISGETFFLNFIILNNGISNIDEQFSFSINDTEGYSLYTGQIMNLESGNHLQQSIPLILNSPGMHEIACVLDSNQELSEDKETDNTSHIIVELGIGGRANLDFAYFTNDSLFVYSNTSTSNSSNSLCIGSLAYASVIVKNSTYRDINESFYVTISNERGLLNSIEVSGLPAYSDTTVSFPFYAKRSGHEFTVDIDYHNQVDEIFETSNSISFHVPVSCESSPFLLDAPRGVQNLAYGWRSGYFSEEPDSINVTQWYSGNDSILSFLSINPDNQAASFQVNVLEPAITEIWYEGTSNTQTYTSAPLRIYINPPWRRLSVELQAGDNLISTYTTSLENVLLEIFLESQVEFIKSDNAYWKKNQPDFLNSMNSIQAGVGYWVYSNEAHTITFEGFHIPSQTLNLHSDGWQLIGVNYTRTISVSTFASDLNASMVKNFDSFWSSSNPNGTLQLIEPGQAYFVYIQQQ